MQPAQHSAAFANPLHASAYARHAAWWEGRLPGRALIMVAATNADYPRPPYAGDLDPKLSELDPAYHAWRAEVDLAGRHWLGDQVPRSYPVVASNLYLQAGVCGWDWRFHNGTAWIETDLTALQRPAPDFRSDHPLILAMEANLRAVAAVVRGRGFVSAPPMLDGFTMLAQLLGGEAFSDALLEDGERVTAWLADWTRLAVAMQGHFATVAATCGLALGSSWLPVCAPGRFETVQCDAGVLVSPAMYRRFVLPGLRTQLAGLDHALYHLDGVEQVRFLDLLATLPGIDGIQWNPQPGQGHINDPRWIEVFRSIRARGWKLHFNDAECPTVDAVATVLEALGPDGLSFTLPDFPTVAEAHAAYARLLPLACA